LAPTTSTTSVARGAASSLAPGAVWLPAQNKLPGQMLSRADPANSPATTPHAAAAAAAAAEDESMHSESLLSGHSMLYLLPVQACPRRHVPQCTRPSHTPHGRRGRYMHRTLFSRYYDAQWNRRRAAASGDSPAGVSRVSSTLLAAWLAGLGCVGVRRVSWRGPECAVRYYTMYVDRWAWAGFNALFSPVHCLPTLLLCPPACLPLLLPLTHVTRHTPTWCTSTA